MDVTNALSGHTLRERIASSFHYALKIFVSYGIIIRR